jgi:hypothetical protein
MTETERLTAIALDAIAKTLGNIDARLSAIECAIDDTCDDDDDDGDAPFVEASGRGMTCADAAKAKEVRELIDEAHDKARSEGWTALAFFAEDTNGTLITGNTTNARIEAHPRPRQPEPEDAANN